MSNQVKGAIALLVLGVGLIMGIYFLNPIIFDREQKQTSDARDTKGKITIAVDNWVGYFPLCSPKMKQMMRGAGYLLNCEDDSADYAGRMEKLDDGEIDFAVATVDSYLLNAESYRFPGTIIMVIDESKGGDAIVAHNKIKSLDDLKKKQKYKIAFTPNSPSEHLLRTVVAHFDIPELQGKKGAWRMETNGSSEALKKLLTGQADVAVLWEPDVSQALAKPGYHKLIGTENTDKVIVDILVVNRKYSEEHADICSLLLSNYFRTLKFYRDNPDTLKKEVAKETKLSEDQVSNMLEGVDWVNLDTNARKWMGVRAGGMTTFDGLIDTIDLTVSTLVTSGDFKNNPIPDEDPYRLVNSQFVAELFVNGIGGQFGKNSNNDQAASFDSLEKKFSALPPKQWDALREVGTLKVRPINYQSGTDLLRLEGKQEIDKVVNTLRHYPNYRVVIKGHTGLRGDPQANQQLSQARADSVLRYLEITYSVDPNRCRAIGLGSTKPLPKRPGESDRAYGYRLPRVELYLVSEVY